MTVVLTIRGVPEEVRDLLARDARERGQSLQAFLVSMLRRQASFSRNLQILAEIEGDLASAGGAGAGAPDAADVLGQARAERDAGAADDGTRGRPSA
jgi:hypothetical protein